MDNSDEHVRCNFCDTRHWCDESEAQIKAGGLICDACNSPPHHLSLESAQTRLIVHLASRQLGHRCPLLERGRERERARYRGALADLLLVAFVHSTFGFIGRGAPFPPSRLAPPERGKVVPLSGQLARTSRLSLPPPSPQGEAGQQAAKLQARVEL